VYYVCNLVVISNLGPGRIDAGPRAYFNDAYDAHHERTTHLNLYAQRRYDSILTLLVRAMPAKPSSALSQVSGQLTFFRLHILAGLFVPLVAAAILYGSNGENHIHFIDALFRSCYALNSLRTMLTNIT
jgi:hypothetical protein